MRSGKTWSIIEFFIQLLYQHKLVLTCFRLEGVRHDEAALRDFKTIMLNKFKSVWDAGKFNSKDKTFTFPNGSEFQFSGTMDEGKLHGPARDIAWYNEVMEITLKSYRQIAGRTRHMSVMDWNPSLSHHWVFDQVINQPNCLYVHSTFRDNPHLTKQQVAFIQQHEPTPENIAAGTADSYFWDVYGLGRRGRREGLIFENWEITDDWPEPMHCERWGFGLDYGSVDPTALVECALHNGELYFRQWLYERNLIVQKNPLSPHIPSIQGRFEDLKLSKKARIIAESARPENNKALRIAGYDIVPVVKQKNSIEVGLNLMKTRQIKIHRDSIDLQREFENYTWKKDTSKKIQTDLKDEPIDDFNHLIDGARYWCLKNLKPFSAAGHHKIPEHQVYSNSVKRIFGRRKEPATLGKRYPWSH